MIFLSVFFFWQPFSLIADLSNLLNYPPRACIINKYLIKLSYFFSRVEWGRKYLRGANMCQSTSVLFKLFLVSRSLSLSLSQARKRFWWDIFCSFLRKPKGKKRGWYVYIYLYLINDILSILLMISITPGDNLLTWNFSFCQVQAVYNAMRRDDRMKYFL
jgi:hypothetical protein